MAGIYDMATAIRQPDARNLAQGLQMGQQLADNRRQNQARNALARLQQGDTSAMAELQQADPDAAMKWGEFQRAEETRNGLQGFFKPATGATNVVGVNSLSALANGQPAQPASFDAMGATQFAASRGDKGALEALMTLQNPKQGTGYATTIWRDGIPYQLTNTPGVLAPLGEGFDAPTQTINLDDRVIVAPKSGKGAPVTTYNKGVSAEAAYGQSQQNQRLERGAQLDVQTAGAKKEIEANVALKTDKNKKASSANTVLGFLDEADALLDKATGSWAGTGVDNVAAAFGESTTGAKANARLRVLQANLMLSQPRMEGPQSDRDVKLYSEAAASLGDSTVPVETRREALKTVREMQRKYAGAAPIKAPATKAAAPKLGEKKNGYVFIGGDPANPKSWRQVK